MRLMLGLNQLGGGGAVATAYISLSASTIAEDQPNTTVIGQLSIVNGNGTYTYILIDSGVGGKIGIVALGSSLANIVVNGPLDFESQPDINIVVQADNGVDASITSQFTITVTNVVETSGFSALMIALGEL